MGRVPDSEIVAAARAHGVPVGLFRGLVFSESGNQTGRVSPAGAFGPTQLMPGTAKGLGVGPNSSTSQLLNAGAKYLKSQLDAQHGNQENALRAYNAGPGAVAQSHQYAETNAYVKKVLDYARAHGDSAPTTSQPTMGDRGGTDARSSSQRVQQGLDVLNAAAPTPTAQNPATEQGQREGKLAAVQRLGHGGDILGFATEIAALRGQEPPKAATSAQPQTPFRAPAGQDGGGERPAGADAGQASGALDYARSKIGHFKENAGSNRGDELDALQQRFGFTGAAWCAMFATMVASKGGMPRAGRSAAVAQVRAWAQAGSNGYEKGVRSVHDARPGDLVMFGNSHIGVVDSVGPDGLHTIEGNTRNGSVTRVDRGWTGDIARPRYGGQ